MGLPSRTAQRAAARGATPKCVVLSGTFDLADEGQMEPVEDLKRALAEVGQDAPEWWVPGFGEGREVPQVEAPP